MRKILIVGAGSYVGTEFEKYVRGSEDCSEYEIESINAVGLVPTVEQFKGFDVVFFVAGIAHIKETKENAHLYYEVNRDLAIKVAETAKNVGVRQFIVMSSMAVYGMTEGVIGKKTKPHPTTHYGRSKLEADRAIWKMRGKDFRVAVLRPPMIYGNGCKGNYQRLRKIAQTLPFFPKVSNSRSMLYVGNLCEFVKQIIDSNSRGLFFPQNAEYVNTSEMVSRVGITNGRNARLITLFNPMIGALKHTPWNVVAKVFGSLMYEKVDLIDKYSFEDSIALTESKIV